jgi:hypothetical protein
MLAFIRLLAAMMVETQFSHVALFQDAPLRRRAAQTVPSPGDDQTSAKISSSQLAVPSCGYSLCGRIIVSTVSASVIGLAEALNGVRPGVGWGNADNSDHGDRSVMVLGMKALQPNRRQRP